MEKKKVIVFGATGTVGAYTSSLLACSGYDVIAVGKRKNDNGFFEKIGAHYYSLDIADEDSFGSLPRSGVKAVVNLAGAMPARMKGYQPNEYVSTIITGSLNVLKYCVSASCDKILFTHTRADSIDYFGKEAPLPDDIQKKFPLTGDHSVYTIFKNAAVDLIEHYYHQHGLSRFVFRLPTIYAYHPDTYYYLNGNRQEMAYWSMIRTAIRGGDLTVWGDPNKKKEIFYVKDMAKVILLGVESNLSGGIYNVGRGVGVTLEEQITGIAEVFSPNDQRCTVNYDPNKPNGRQFVHSIEKLRKELGFEPEYDYMGMLLDIKKEMQVKPFKNLWGQGDL